MNLRRLRALPLIAVLLMALLLRLLLWGRVPRTGLISDEGEYLSAANWLAHGRGFSWYQGYLWTRAPIYPLFVAAHLRLFGDTLTPIYITQTILSLVNVALIYFLATYLATDEHVSQFSILNSQFSIPTLAALLMAIYFPFALYAQVLLSETLFITLLLGGFLALAIWTQDQGPRTKGQPQRSSFVFHLSTFIFQEWSLVIAGVLFGLATLTRSLTLLFLPIVAVWVLMHSKNREPRAENRLSPDPGLGSRFSVLCSLFFVLCALLTIAPWTIYNSTRLYGGLVIVDTSGAFNLLLGARTAYDGKREDAPPRNFMLALLKNQPYEQRLKLLEAQGASDGRVLGAACLLRRRDPQLLAALSRPVTATTQAERQQLTTAEGLCLLSESPGAFIRKSVGELVDLFQINYTGDERFTDSFTLGRLPRWYAAALFLLDDTIYVLVLPLAVIGWALRREIGDWRLEIRRADTTNLQSPISTLIGIWWLYNIAVAPLLFAINRFRLPLLPFAFILAAYALAALPYGGWRALRSRYGLLCTALAALLALVVATPYAYLEPREPGAPSQWASYLGPYPSSVVDTVLAWQSRPSYLREQQLMRALGRGDAAEARTLLAAGNLTARTRSFAQPLLAGLEGRIVEGLSMVPLPETIIGSLNVHAAVIRGDLLRRKGDLNGAKAILTPTFVDNSNPVQWAWDWLHPPPLPNNRIDLAGNLDLGYIEGCYLGEGTQDGTFRWCTDGARLRFPGAGTGAPQTLALRADGRGWFDGLLPVPPVHVFLGEQEIGTFTPDSAAIRELAVALPASPAGADVVVSLRTSTFIPPAERYISQQGAQVGQVHRLGVRLDWAELRDNIEN
jgi:hypothetical protein